MPKRNVGSQWRSFGVDLVLCMAGSEYSSDLASRLCIFFSVLLSSFSDTFSPHGRKDGRWQLSLLIFIVLVPQGKGRERPYFFQYPYMKSDGETYDGSWLDQIPCPWPVTVDSVREDPVRGQAWRACPSNRRVSPLVAPPYPKDRDEQLAACVLCSHHAEDEEEQRR